MDDKFDMPTRKKVIFSCLKSAHAQDFLLDVPIDRLDQNMSPVEYRTILRYNLMIHLFPIDEICPIFRKVSLDTFGEHTTHCRELSGFKYQYDLVKDVIFDIYSAGWTICEKRGPVNFLTDPYDERSTLSAYKYSGVHVSMRDTCLYGLDWSFSIGRTEDCGTNNS